MADEQNDQGMLPPPSISQQTSRIDPSIISTIIDHTILIETFKHNLRGEIWDGKDEKWIKKFKPTISEDGVNELGADLHFHANAINSLGNINEQSYMLAVREAASAENFKLMAKKDLWGMSDDAQLDVGIAYLNLVASLYSQALEGGLQRRILTQILRHETISESKTQPQGFRLPSLPFFGKK